ncbi:hypothetical protein AB1Y20_019808 [Prymnesium parvum]|uniref:Peptidase S9 prolyl oligopeptidase catalytic domain-containing protein n=1 Tax=Prymnesium parvum TaxID=97485 RepID=A0AB34JS30_PRYPA
MSMSLVKPLLGFLAARYVYLQYSKVLLHLDTPLPLRVAVHTSFVLAVLLGVLYLKQEALLYVPEMPGPSGIKMVTPADNPRGMRSPKDHDLPFTNLKLRCSDGVLVHAWFIPAPAAAASAPTLLFSHENAGNVGLRLHEFVAWHHKLGANVLAYDYRGYGFSDRAAINEEGLMRDARAAWRWVEKAAADGLIDPAKVFLYGRSLGGAVTIQLAAELCAARASGAASLLPAGVIASNTFTSIEDMLGAVYPWLNWQFVRRWLLRLKWRSIEHIRQVRLPILFIRGLQDEIVPADHTLRLRDAAEAATSVQVHTVPDGTHNDTWLKAGEDYFAWLRSFMQEAGSRQR